MTQHITDDRAARRFHQIATLERELARTTHDLVQCQEHAKELKDQRDGLVHRLRRAARDEGELPLFDLDE